MFYVYILNCIDNSFYVGSTADLENRIYQHNNSRYGSFYLRSKLPAILVYSEIHQTRIEAMRRERQLKGWTRQKKINLIKGLHPNINK